MSNDGTPAFECAYQAAHMSGLLPGVVVMAASRKGEFRYFKMIGMRSVKPGENKPMELDTVLALASCTKLMTAVSALQCVERGLISLDEDVTPILPEVGKFGIITGFDDTTGQPITTPNTKPVTIRHLLSHTSGYQYDLMSPLLYKWRASRGEAPWSGATVEEKSTLPLMFEPGSSWMYGAGHDWTGKIIERVTGQTHEDYMSENIWNPLNIKDITFWPKERPDMKDRIAELSTLDPSGSGKAVDAPDLDVNGGIKECLGGGGAFASSKAFMALLHSVLNEDPKLLKPSSYEELFRPQLDEHCKKAFNDLLLSDQQMQEYLGINVPTSGQKTWTFGGLLSLDDYPGWMNKNTLLWGGVPNIVWFIDREAGFCAFAGCQVLPPMTPPIMKLHEQFQHGIYQLHAAAKAASGAE